MYFSPEPEKFFPYAQINMVQFTDDLGGDQIIAKAFKGPLHQQLQKALQYIRNTGLQKIILAMKANGSSMPNFETDEERTYFLTMFLLHPDFTDTDDGINVGLNDRKTEYANLTAKERTVLYLIQQNQAFRTKHIIRITEENPYEKTGYTQDRRV